MLQAACTCGSGPYEGDYYDADRPDPVQNVKYQESVKGDPKVIGCADGQREAFADVKKHPRIAGCLGKWTGAKGLRDKPTGKACGDDGSKCEGPADVCSAGWHVCGVGGKGEDLRDRAAVADCHAAGPGRFNAALSHSISDEVDPCPVIASNADLPCFTAGLGAEPVCCGSDCLYGKCKDGVWKDKTKISRGTSEGCGKLTSERNGGVLCCYDGEGNPSETIAADAKAADTAPADPAAAGDTKAGDTKAGDTKAGDTKAGDTKTGDTKTGDTKTGDTKADAKAGDTKAGPLGGGGADKNAGDSKANPDGGKATAKNTEGAKPGDAKAG